jgi:Branched-chain amino acid transport protein (AzlD)
MTGELQGFFGSLWPYLVVIVIGFLPTEIWRSAGVLLGRSIDPDGEAMRWVRAVATALVVAVVAKLVLAPTGALTQVPMWGRVGALGAGIVALFLLGRSVPLALAIGLLVLVLAGAVASGR